MIGTFLFINVVLLSINIERRVLIEKSYEQINSCNEKHNELLNSLKESLVLKYKIEGSHFESDESIASEIKLYYKLNNKSCGGCVENVSHLLGSNPQYYKSNKIVVLCDFINYNEKQFYKKEYFPVIVDFKTKTKNSLDKSYISYFFTLDSEKRMRNVFIPDKNFPFLTLLYLENVLKSEI